MTLPLNPLSWPPDAREEWEERAAQIEYLANVPRPEAERRATVIVRERWSKARSVVDSEPS